MRIQALPVQSWPVAVLTLCLVGGCGTTPPVQSDVRDPVVYARSTQNRVVRAIDGIAKQPSTAPQRVERLVATLAKYPDAPVGDNEATFAELLQAAETLQQRVEARAKNLQPEIDRLREIADRLTAGDGVTGA